MDSIKVYQILEKQGFSKENAHAIIDTVVEYKEFLSNIEIRFNRIEARLDQIANSMRDLKQMLK